MIKLFIFPLLCLTPQFATATAMHDAAREGNVQAVAKLLASNSHSVDETNAVGDTPLHIAAAFGQYGVAQVLVSSNATVDVKDRLGLTPLELAVFTRRWAESNALQTTLVGIGAFLVVVSNVFAAVQAETAAGFQTKGKRLKSLLQSPEELPEVVVAKRQIVDLLLSHGATVTNESGFSAALELACMNPEGTMLRLLLKHGANPKQSDLLRFQPIHGAAVWANRDGIAALIQAGADVDAPGSDTQVRPLLSACCAGDEETVRVLLSAGANISLPSSTGKLPIHGALEAASEPIVSLLLERGANVKAADNRNTTPVHVAANNGSEKLLALLIEKGAEIEAKDNEGFTPLLNAVEYGNSKAADFLVSRGANPLATSTARRGALHIAARDNRLELMQWALDHGCDVNLRDKAGMTPVHEAALQGHTKAVELLLRNKASPKSMSSTLNMPLHEAARGYYFNSLLVSQQKTNAFPNPLAPFGSLADYAATAALLLTNGSPVDPENIELATPLYLAAAGSFEVLKLLLEHGAQVNIRDVKGFTPLMIAARAGTAEIAELLIAKGAQIDAAQQDGQTPLLWAASDGNVSVLKVLLHHKCDSKSRNALQATGLHLAAVRGHVDAAAVLLEGGANINANDTYGQTPLHVAVLSRQRAMVEFLISQHADLSLTDRQNMTALDSAKNAGFFEISQLLESPRHRPK